jgi:hypothetical protein
MERNLRASSKACGILAQNRLSVWKTTRAKFAAAYFVTVCVSAA